MHSADKSQSKHLWDVSTGLQPLADNPVAPVVTQEPIRINNPSRRLRLPGFVQKLRTQYPPAGMFNVHDLDWEVVGTGKQMGLVAAFPRQRLHDFRMGESHRAGCKVLIGSYKATTESVLLNDRGLCVFGAPSYAVGKKRQAAPAEPASNSHTDCGVARYGKTPDAQSKKNCAYCCYARVYAKCQYVVIVKFPCYEGDTPETCMTMKHCTPDGQSAHVGVEGHRHLRQWSTEATSLIIARLKLHVKPSVIIQDVKKSILHGLNIPEDSPPEETREIISASRFSKDFYVNNSRIQYLRRKYVEPEGACSSGTAATAGTPDDSSATAAPAASPRPMHDGVSEGAPAATDAAADQVQHTVLRALASAAVPNAQGQGQGGGAQAPRSAVASALGAVTGVGHAAEEDSPAIGATQLSIDTVAPAETAHLGIATSGRQQHAPVREEAGSDTHLHAVAQAEVTAQLHPFLMALIDEGGAPARQAVADLVAAPVDAPVGHRVAQPCVEHSNFYVKRSSSQLALSDQPKRVKCTDSPQEELLPVLVQPRAREASTAQLAQAHEQHRLEQLLLSLIEQKQMEERSVHQLELLLQHRWQQQLWEQQWQQLQQLLQSRAAVQPTDVQQQAGGQLQDLLRLLGISL